MGFRLEQCKLCGQEVEIDESDPKKLLLNPQARQEEASQGTAHLPRQAKEIHSANNARNGEAIRRRVYAL
jgi:hypothetical protein